MTQHEFPTEAKDREISPEVWNVLCTVQFPEASARGILLAWDTAKAKGLDILSGHLAIVTKSKWNPETRKHDYYETAWPTVKASTAIAHRTNLFAGMDPIVFGEDVTQTFSSGGNNAKEQTLTYPISASATVYRMMDGVRCPFTETVFFLEFGQFRDGLPNWNWLVKPRMMLSKCAKAAALRLAFPECGYSAEEMEGNSASIENDAIPSSDGVDERSAVSLASNQELKNVAYTVMSDDSHAWLSRTLETAINTGAFTSALSNALTSLDPTMQGTARRVLDSAKSIAQSQNSDKIFEFLSKVKKAAAYEHARNTLRERMEKGQVSTNEYQSSLNLMDFYQQADTKHVA